MTHYPLEKNISGVVFIGNKGSKLLSTENNFVYDSGNNRLGINTGTPLYTLDVNGTGNFIAIRFPDGSIQSTAGAGSGFSYYDFNLAAGNESSTVISSGETISFTGFGNTVVTRVGNAIRISGLDTNTTYIAGTGLNLIGTTFNVSGSTTSNSGIVQLQDSIVDNIVNRAVTPNAVFDYVGSVSGAIDTRLISTGNDLLSRINTLSGNLVTTGANLQSNINTLSGLILSSSGSITSGSPYGLAYFDSGSSLKSSTINSDIQFKILANSGISFEGSQGQLFSIVNNLSSGVIFNVNDIAGLPLIEADANGYVNLVRYGETVSIGSYAESGSRLTLTPGMASRRGVVISGHPGQTADLFEVINASGNMLFAIMPDGSTAVGTGFASARLDVVDTGSNIIPTLRLMNLNANFDPYIRFTPSTTGNSFAVGIDDSDSDKFKLSYGADLGTNDRLIISTGGHVGINNTSPSDTLIVNTLNSSTKGLVVQGSAAQSANLTEWQSSAGTIHSMVNSNGWFGINKSNAVYHLDVLGTGNFSAGVRYPDGLVQTIAYTGLNGIATSGYVNQISGVLNTRLISTGNDLLGRINTLSGNLITTGSNLQSQINSVSGLLYNYWTLNITGSNDQITRQQTVTFTGTGATSVSYNSSTNTVTINSIDTNTTYTAGTGLNLVGTTFNVSGSTTSNSGIVQLQDSVVDNVTNRAVTPNAVFDYVGGVSGAIDSRLVATGNNLQSQINAKDNYQYWILRGDSPTTTQIQTTEEVQFTGAGNVSISLGGTDNRRVTISGSTQAITGPAETIAFFTGNNTLTGSPSLTYDPIKTSFKLITQGDSPSTGFVILNNQNQSGNVFQIRSYIDDVDSTTYNNTYFAGTGDGSYTSNAGFNNTNTIIELLQGSGTFTTGFFPFFITGFVPGKTIIEDGAILTISNAQSFLTGLIEGDLALYTGDNNPVAPTNTGTLATQVTQLSVPIPFTISGSGSNSTTDIDLTALMNQYFNLYPTNTGNILLYYSVYSSTGSVDQQGIGAGNNASTGLRPRLDVLFTTFEYAGTSTNKPIYSVDHVGRIKIGNIERSDQLINSFLLYASGEPNQNANVQIESPNRDARVLFTKNNNKVFSAGTVASDSRFIIKDEINWTTPFQIYPQAKNNGLIVLRNGFIGIKTFNPEYTLHVNGEGWIKALRFYRYTKESEVPRTIRNIYSIKEDLYWNGKKLALGGDFSYSWTVRDGDGNADVVGDGASIYWSGAGNVSTLFSPSSSIMRISGSPGWNLGVGNESTISVANNANITFTGLDGIRVSRSSNQIRISGASIGPATTSTSGIVQLQDSIVDNVTDRAVTPNAVFDYVGSVSGAIDTRIINTGSNLQGQINSVSGLLYNYWTLIAPGAAADNITRQQSVTFTGTGATSVSYNTGTNVLTITSTDTNTTYSAGTGLNLVGTTFNVSGSTTSNSGIVQLQDSVQDNITNRAITPNAVFDYVASVSGAIDTRIISTGNNLQSQINSISGSTIGAASGVAFFSNAGTITGSPNFTYSSGTATLNINGTLTAISKSFLIDHPTKPDKKLQYSSLESPYHGVRLTGRDKLKNNTCTIQLPEYIYNLVKEEGINIQITNIRHSQIIYVDSIDLLNNRFTVACNNIDYYHPYEFFWTFTAIRKDIDDLEVEV